MFPKLKAKWKTLWSICGCASFVWITYGAFGVQFVAEMLRVARGTHWRIEDLNVEAWMFWGMLLWDDPDKNVCHCGGAANTSWCLHYSKKLLAVDANKLYHIKPKALELTFERFTQRACQYMLLFGEKKRRKKKQQQLLTRKRICVSSAR